MTKIWDEKRDRQACILELLAEIGGWKFAADRYHTTEARNKVTIAVERDAEVIKSYKENHGGIVLDAMQLQRYLKHSNAEAPMLA